MRTDVKTALKAENLTNLNNKNIRFLANNNKFILVF